MSPHHARGRESGFATIYAMILVTFLMALAAAVTLLCNVGLRAGTESRNQLKAFYAADTGAQIAAASLRAADGVMAETSLTEELGDGGASVTILPLGSGLYEIDSEGTSSGQSAQIVMHMRFLPAFDMDGALQLNFDEGVQVSADHLHVEINSSALISGANHDASGSVMADQSEATWGVALPPVPGEVDVDVEVDTINGAELVGGTTNTAEGQSETLNELVKYARTHADVSVSGGTVVNDSDAGTLGTAVDPALVYVELGDEETFEMQQAVTGHGTLIIDAGDVTLDSVLKMQDTAQWHGLVVIHLRSQADVEDGALVKMWDDAGILGGLALSFNGDGVTITDSGNIIEMGTGASSIRYSSTLANGAVGLSAVASEAARIISYQID